MFKVFQGLPLFRLRNLDPACDYDCNQGFVIAARDEQAARSICQAQLGTEISRYRDFWLDQKKASCEQISDTSIYEEETTVLMDFLHG